MACTMLDSEGVGIYKPVIVVGASFSTLDEYQKPSVSYAGHCAAEVKRSRAFILKIRIGWLDF